QSIQFLMLTPLPGTKLYYDLVKEDRLISRDWSLYDAHHVVYTPKLMTYYELQTETMKATGEFYSFGQIIKAAAHLDIFNFAIKMYGYKLTRQWFKTHEYFVEYTEKITNAGKIIELAARKTAEDLKEKFEQMELAGNLTIQKNHHPS
ncbi:MAG: hypothetical protein V3T30_08575, partial [Thermodesulfobacteriota bacterium]